LPAERKSDQAVFSGSIIRQGEIGALVYATGANTYFGKAASLVQEAHTVSHFQKVVLKIGNYLIILAVAMVAVIITVAIFRGDAILTTLQFALVLTVAVISVAMPTVLAVTTAVGARLLAKKQAIVSRLVAIEELAGVDVLCADIWEAFRLRRDLPNLLFDPNLLRKMLLYWRRKSFALARSSLKSFWILVMSGAAVPQNWDFVQARVQDPMSAWDENRLKPNTLTRKFH